MTTKEAAGLEKKTDGEMRAKSVRTANADSKKAPRAQGQSSGKTNQTQKKSTKPGTSVPEKPSEKAHKEPRKALPKKAQKGISKKLSKKMQKKRRRMIAQAAAFLAELIVVVLIGMVVFGRGGTPQASTPAAAQSAEPTEEIAAEPLIELTEEPAPSPTAELLPLNDLAQYTEGGLKLGAAQEDVLPYQIYVSKDSFTIAILGIDEGGEYTRLLRTWRTAIGTGNKTRAGSYEIGKKYLWYEWALGGYTPYTCRLADSSIRIHSPLHNENKDWESLYREGYRQIGDKKTQGCLRTTTAGAAWIYYNCPVGTAVIVKNDEMYTSEEPPALGDSRSDPTRPKSSDDLEIPVTFFELGTEALTMNRGDTYALSVTGVMPTLSEHEEQDEIAHRFVYVSGNENVVQVDDSGLITAVGPGSAELLVMADDVGRVYRIVQVTVASN